MVRLNSCLVAIWAWMADNFLKVNSRQNWTASHGKPKRRVKDKHFQVQFLDNTFKPPARATNMGSIFDSTLPVQTLLNKTTASTMYYIRTLAATRDHFLGTDTSRLFSSVIINRLNYWHSVLSGIPQCSLRILQLALNMAAGLVFKARRSCQVSHLLDQLKWLPIEKR